MFKFARDWHGIYASDGNAMKGADNELRGLANVLGANVSGLAVPMM